MDFKIPKINLNFKLPDTFENSNDFIVVSSVNENKEKNDDLKKLSLSDNDGGIVRFIKNVFAKTNLKFKIDEKSHTVQNDFIKFIFDKNMKIVYEKEKIVVKRDKIFFIITDSEVECLENMKVAIDINDKYKKNKNLYLPNLVFSDGKNFITYLTDFSIEKNDKENFINFKKGNIFKIFSSKNIDDLFYYVYKDINVTDSVFDLEINNFFNKKYKIWIEKLNLMNQDLNKIVTSIFSYKIKYNPNNFPEAKIEELNNSYGYKFDLSSALFLGNVMEKERIFYNNSLNSIYTYQSYFYQNRLEPLLDIDNLLNSLMLFPDIIPESLILQYLGKIKIENLNIDMLTGYCKLSLKYKKMGNEDILNLIKFFIEKISLQKDFYGFNESSSFSTLFLFNELARRSENSNFIKLSKYFIILKIKNDKTILSEDIYQYFSDNYPRLREVGTENKRWVIYSAIKDISVIDEDSFLTFTINGNVGETYNLVIYNIKNFSGYYMFDKDWQRDYMYQKYYSGSFFDYNNRKLFVKIKMRSDKEQIKVKYY